MQSFTKIDKFDELILQELKNNGRMPNTELAEKIGLSPSACLRRVQELEKRRTIKGYRAVLNNENMGINFVALIGVGLRDHSIDSQLAFEKAISSAEEVKECHNVTGAFEYFLRIETKDINSYKRFHADVLGSIPQVSTITTHVVMDSPKDERA
jgi:Lrp/AsnC family transcriptional regulator, leucine-responsive regulatory protein